tara:strand:+ start:17 stop:748 length:732 start_codon:yes stop_codon:yes gene_type:complete
MSLAVALIPARKGSKRIPGKNIRLLKGKPLIQYSIEHALSTKLIDKVVVSTDDDEVIKVSKTFNCEIIKRPNELATDKTTTIEVVKHCIETLKRTGEFVGYLIILQPTVPIRDVKKIEEAIVILKKTGCDSVISHIKVDYFHPNRMKKIINGQIVPYYEKELEKVSRDKLPEAYYRDGSIYAMRANLPMEENTLYGDTTRPIINDRNKFVNIDEERDWKMAEWLMDNIATTIKVEKTPIKDGE